MKKGKHHALLLFAGNLWGRPSLLAVNGEEAVRAVRNKGTRLEEGLYFGEAMDEPQEVLGLFVWEGECREGEWHYDWDAKPGWREVTRADLELFGFPLPEA